MTSNSEVFEKLVAEAHSKTKITIPVTIDIGQLLTTKIELDAQPKSVGSKLIKAAEDWLTHKKFEPYEERSKRVTIIFSSSRRSGAKQCEVSLST